MGNLLFTSNGNMIYRMLYFYMTMGPEYQLYMYSFQMFIKLFLYLRSSKSSSKTILLSSYYTKKEQSKKENNIEDDNDEPFLVIDKSSDT